MNYFEMVGINFSTLKYIFRSDAYYKYMLANPRESTGAMALGTLVHELILEGKTADLSTIVKVKKDGTLYEKDKELVEKYEGIQQLEYFHDFTSDDFVVEQGLLFEYKGLQFKGKIDAYHKESKTLIDLKTTRDVQFFEYDFFKMKYDMQLYMYSEALRQNGFEVDHVQVYCVCTDAPYEQKMYTLDPAVILNGKRSFDKAIELLEKAEDELEGFLTLPAHKVKILENEGYFNE